MHPLSIHNRNLLYVTCRVYRLLLFKDEVCLSNSECLGICIACILNVKAYLNCIENIDV